MATEYSPESKGARPAAAGQSAAPAQSEVDWPRINDMAGHLRQHYGAERIWLFGSYARGTANADSDLDLMIVAPVKEGFYDRMASVHRLLREQRGNLPISPIVLTPSELRERLRKGDQFIAEVVQEGIEL